MTEPTELAEQVLANNRNFVREHNHKRVTLREVMCPCGKTFNTTSKRVKFCAKCRKLDTIGSDRLARYGIEPGHTYSQWLRVLQDQNMLCYYCQRTMNKFSWSKDHKIPLCRGGNDRIENIVACCRSCNCKKGTMADQEFIKKYGNELGVVSDERMFRKIEDALEDYYYFSGAYEPQKNFGKSNSQLVVVGSIRGRIGNRTAE